MTGVGFSFIVPEGGYVAIEFPALPNGKPSGVTTTLGSVREEQEDTVLPVGEVGLYQEGGEHAVQGIMRCRSTLRLGALLSPRSVPRA